MRNYFTNPVRAVLLAAALVFAAGAIEARAAGATVATARTRADEYPAERDEAPVGGLLIIAGVVAGVILLAWICSRVGDNPRGNLMS
jgi:hypothetical protein